MPIRTFHSPDWGGAGSSDVPPPPSWLTEGLASAGGVDPVAGTWQGSTSQQGWTADQDANAWDESGQQEPVWEQPPAEDQVIWGDQSQYDQEGAQEHWGTDQSSDTNNLRWQQGGQSSGSYPQPTFEQGNFDGGLASPPPAPQYGEDFGAGLQGREFDQFPTQGEGVPYFGQHDQPSSPYSAPGGGDFSAPPQPPPPPMAPALPVLPKNTKPESSLPPTPSFSQPSVASLRNRALDPSDPDGILLSPVTEPDPMTPSFGQNPGGPSLGMGGFGGLAPPPPPGLAPMHEGTEPPPGLGGHQASPLYQGTLPGSGPGGTPVPAFVPDFSQDSAEEDNWGILGCRTAAGTYALFGAMAAIGTFQSGNMLGLACVLVPIVAVSAALMTGARWAAVVAMVLSTLLGLLLMGLGLFWQVLMGKLSEVGAPITFSPILGFALVVQGATIIAGNAMMLFWNPGIGRALSGAALVLLPTMGINIMVINMDMRPTLNAPTGMFTQEVVLNQEKGFAFTKPEGWNSYQWELVTGLSPLAQGLKTTPDYHYLDRRQRMMVTIYTTAPPRRSLTQLFGASEMTDFEKEITRELPARGDKPDEYDFGGFKFSERLHEGTLQSGVALSIIVSQARISDDQMLFIVVTRDTRGNTTSEQAANALNAFFKELTFTGSNNRQK